MLRIVSAVIRGITAHTNVAKVNSVLPKQCSLVKEVQQRCFGAISSSAERWTNLENDRQKTLLNCTQTDCVVPLTFLPVKTQTRTVIKFSLQKGKRKTVKAVVERFYRLNWGIWIRTKAARHRRLWTKTSARKRRLRQHVFCNATQSTLLDKMVTSYWRRPRFYVNDPYNPYHKREEFPYTRKKPLP